MTTLYGVPPELVGDVLKALELSPASHDEALELAQRRDSGVRRVSMTPRLAKEFLSRYDICFVRNLPINPGDVRRYADLMRRSLWQGVSTVRVGFSSLDAPQPSLLDGKRRLRAVMEAGATVDMVLRYGHRPVLAPRRSTL